MKILVAGGTGFIGSSLIPALQAQGHEVIILTRSPKNKDHLSWNALETTLPDLFDIVINLTGENIGNKRWTEKRKKLLKDSRIIPTTKLTQWLSQTNKKIHLYNASAYLPSEKNYFSYELITEWEKTASLHSPITITRFGVVLKRNGGVLQKLEPSFFMGLGSIMGNGKQAFSWIHLDDLINAYIFLINHPEITGPIEVCSPGNIPQESFAKSLAKAMHRPLFMKLPAFLIKILFGQMGEELLLAGQKAYPDILEKNGFKFTYPTIESALKNLYI